MQRFQFPLEQALKWRTTRLELENAKLARLQQERESATRLRGTICETAQREVAAFLHGSPGATGAELTLLAGYRRGIAARLKKLEMAIRNCEAGIEQQKATVLEADREKRLLESLKQRQLDEWNYELNREIENTAGELFLANRRRSPRG